MIGVWKCHQVYAKWMQTIMFGDTFDGKCKRDGKFKDFFLQKL